MPFVNQHHESSISQHMQHFGISGVPTATQQSISASTFVHHAPQTFVNQHHDSSISQHMHQFGVAGVPTNTQQSVSASSFVRHVPQPFVDLYAAPDSGEAVSVASTGIYAEDIIGNRAAHACQMVCRRSSSRGDMLNGVPLWVVQQGLHKSKLAFIPGWTRKAGHQAPGGGQSAHVVGSALKVRMVLEGRNTSFPLLPCNLSGEPGGQPAEITCRLSKSGYPHQHHQLAATLNQPFLLYQPVQEDFLGGRKRHEYDSSRSGVEYELQKVLALRGCCISGAVMYVLLLCTF